MALQKIRIGTRGSRLALVQTNMVADLLRQAHAELDIEIVEILTSGDWRPEQGETRLAEAEGGKGQFAKEIENALLEDRIDCAVHSMKDMESFLPDGLIIEHMLPREDPRDAFLANNAKILADLPEGATVGTSSLRRQAFLLAKKPDLNIVPLRGNVPTRIEKLRNGRVDATILALSGLKRLALEKEASSIFSEEEMLPAAGQGAIGIEIKSNNKELYSILDVIHCKETGFCVTAERAALQILDGSCHTPVGAYATLDGADMALTVTVAAPDGSEVYSETNSTTVTSIENAKTLGTEIGTILKEQIPPELLAA